MPKITDPAPKPTSSPTKPPLPTVEEQARGMRYVPTTPTRVDDDVSDADDGDNDNDVVDEIPTIPSEAAPSRPSSEQSPEVTSSVLRPFHFHGFDVNHKGGREAVGSCPICGKDEKLYVNVETGQWNCRTGCWSGNRESLLAKIWEHSAFDSVRGIELAKNRGLLELGTLEWWGWRVSCVSGDWIVPGWSGTGKIVDLYTWRKDFKSGKMRLYSSPEAGKGMGRLLTGDKAAGEFVGPADLDSERILVAEGYSDAMVLWEVVGEVCDVVSTPGAEVWGDDWTTKFEGKAVTFLYHNDHPHTNGPTGAIGEPAGFRGVKRAAGVLKGLPADKAAAEVNYLFWGEEGYDSALPSGYDVRDHLTKGTTLAGRQEAWEDLFRRVTSVPADWPAVKLGAEELTPLDCSSWDNLIMAWREALEMSDGHEKALAVMLSVVVSTMTVGEQLWCRVISPPASGKTTLCEGISVAKEFAHEVSHMTGLHSGYKNDKEGSEDYSLLSRIISKTLVIKEGNTLITAANREAIMNELRDAYDGNSHVHYKHLHRDYENFRFTVIIACTAALLKLDSAEMGARFLDCVIMDKIDPDLERRIIRRGILSNVRNIGTAVTGDAETSGDPKKVKAKRLTGGYVKYLRHNASRLLSSVADSLDADYVDDIMNCAEFVAFMRARPSKEQSEVAEREVGTRLANQMTRLALCLAAVTGRSKVDDFVIDRVRSVARDSSRGKTVDYVKYLYGRKDGATEEMSYIALNESELKFGELRRYLQKIEVIETIPQKGVPRAYARYRLTKRVRQLYENVVRPEAAADV